jgi:hypothetical protein
MDISNNETHSFMEKLIDWKEFEQFIAEMYKASDDVVVEHDVTLEGKSNAKRQIDVLVTQTMALHTYTTIIECKRWKDPVTRQVIDVVYAAVEDLNANKGVLFTTKGYEKGAIEYAKSKDIDIFLIRDIREEEFGNPGKKFSLYLQFFNGKLSNFGVQNAKFLSLDGAPLTVPPPTFQIHFSQNQVLPQEYQLVSIDYTEGQNLVELLIGIRARLLKDTCDLFNSIILPEDQEVELADKARVTIDFSEYNFRFLRHRNGLIQLDEMSFDLVRHIRQKKMNFDRTASMDIALVVENFITNQKNVVSRKKNENQVKLSVPLIEGDENESRTVQDKSVVKMTMTHYIDLDIKPSTTIKDANVIVVKMENKPSEEN